MKDHHKCSDSLLMRSPIFHSKNMNYNNHICRKRYIKHEPVKCLRRQLPMKKTDQAFRHSLNQAGK